MTAETDTAPETTEAVPAGQGEPQVLDIPPEQLLGYYQQVLANLNNEVHYLKALTQWQASVVAALTQQIVDLEAHHAQPHEH